MASRAVQRPRLRWRATAAGPGVIEDLGPPVEELFQAGPQGFVMCVGHSRIVTAGWDGVYRGWSGQSSVVQQFREKSMSYDLVIKNGTVVDGTGAKRYQADVAIADGKVAEIGKVTEGAKRTIDAHGLVVAPGFVDPHTHYDAQICWDGAVTPSSWHGVTSVVMGNCGVGIAPCKPAAREIAMKDLVNVEGIPFDVLNKGITWDWETFPQFMDAAAARKPSLNLAFIAPLTPFRHYVMGEASMERAATRGGDGEDRRA